MIETFLNQPFQLMITCFFDVEMLNKALSGDIYGADLSKISNKQAHRVATELSRLESYPECNQHRILTIEFNQTPQ